MLYMDRRAGTRRLAEAGLGAGDKAGVAATEQKLQKRDIQKGMVFSGMGPVRPHPPLHEIFINSTLNISGVVSTLALYVC